jgi:urease accessory protein
MSATVGPAPANVRPRGTDPAGAGACLPSRTGRDGFLEAGFALREGRTVLTRRRFRTPLQLLEPLTLGGDPAAWLVLLNPTGGVLGGDRLITELDLGAGTHVGVTTPSATRVYRSEGSPASIETRVSVRQGATLEYVPDHVIPQAGARLRQVLRVDLAPTARTILWDAVALARPARGERWAFASLETEIELTCEGRALFLDRARLDERGSRLAGLGGMDGLAYAATLVVVAPCRADWDGLVDDLAEVVGVESAWLGGASPLPRGGCVARLLTASAHEQAEGREALWRCARRHLLGLGGVDLRKG